MNNANSDYALYVERPVGKKLITIDNAPESNIFLLIII